MDPSWLAWAKRLEAIAQTGLEFATDPYDRERYTAIRGIAAAMLAAGAGTEPRRIEGLLADAGYATPKVDVRAAVFRDGRILLVRERQDGLWTLPGGWADVGDSPGEAAEREVREESGYIVRATKLAAVFDRNRHEHPPMIHHSWKLFFLCELLGGEPAASAETDGTGFFAPDDLPPLSVRRTTRGQILHMFEHHREPGLPTSFD